MSGRAVEAAATPRPFSSTRRDDNAGEPDGVGFLPAWRNSEESVAEAAQTGLSRRTRRPEGRSIVVLAKDAFAIRGRDMAPANVHPFSRHTNVRSPMSDGRQVRKRCRRLSQQWCRRTEGSIPDDLGRSWSESPGRVGRPLSWPTAGRARVIELRTVVKQGLASVSRDAAMGIR